MQTSESVTSGHPDKLCDYISDSILDECLRLDPEARVAVEVFVKGISPENKKPPHSFIIIGGEVTLKEGIVINYEKIARSAAIEIGYDSTSNGMDASSVELCEVRVLIGEQSRFISEGVTKGLGLDTQQGAGDQGIMYGYASCESEYYETLKGRFMPLPILLSHDLTSALTKSINDGDLDWARPDGKSQVTISYDKDNMPIRIETVIIAIQHNDLANDRYGGDLSREREFIKKEIREKIIEKYLPLELLNDDINIIINGTGRFLIGGPEGDAGLTGRKIIVDTYGGIGRHGGGAFSGKDPSKVDRSGAYMARYVAKHIVASGLAERCEIQLAYGIGIANPISMHINVNTMGTGLVNDSEIEKKVIKIFDFRPGSIISKLNLKRPIYKSTSSGGHFGRNITNSDLFPWEIIDSDIIKKINEIK